ncbi:MAG: lysophospholipid acyltransferase family protein [Asticcacaulis sp.]
MKKLLESEFMQTLIAVIIVNYLKFCYATTRWHIENQAEVEAIWAAKGPVVLMFWHGRLHLGHASWPRDRAQPVCVLASLSKSGNVSVKINTHFGYHSIRGSSAKKSDPNKAKGGMAAFRDLLRWIRGDENGGRCVAMTPDGPRGPSQMMTDGSLKLSQLSAAPLVLLGQSTKNFMEFKTWDRMRVPLPFTRGAMVWGVLPAIPKDCDDTEFERLRLEAEQALTQATDRADELLGLRT